jgi:ADP-ribosylation factor related protein 1
MDYLTDCNFHTVGKISLPSTVLQFFDLGGQRDIRSIWPRYYDECHAVVFVLDAADQARLSETWEVFGAFTVILPV